MKSAAFVGQLGQRNKEESFYSPVGKNRYPTHGSVRMYRGWEGSFSTFFRSWPTKTRKYSVCSVKLPPQIAVRIARWVTTLPRLLKRNTRRPNSFGVR